MFQFSGFPSYDYFIHHTMTEYCSAGFPHSEICGSKDICSYPQLIAACHVLLRLLMPRHSPCALLSLTSLGSPFELNYMSFFPFEIEFFLPFTEKLIHHSLHCSVFKVQRRNWLNSILHSQYLLFRCYSFFVKSLALLTCSFVNALATVRYRYQLFTSLFRCFRILVGLGGLEPPTSRLSGVRSSLLSYKPM